MGEYYERGRSMGRRTRITSLEELAALFESGDTILVDVLPAAPPWHMTAEEMAESVKELVGTDG